MNHQARLAIDAHILGDGDLQERFSAYVEMLGHIVLHAPRPVDSAQMAGMSNLPVAALRRYFHELSRAGILKKSAAAQHAWNLVKNPCDVTLNDVFRCAVVANCGMSRRAASLRAPPAVNEDVEILLMQALQAVDDHIYKHLGTYSLDRLKISGAAPFPVRYRHGALPFAEID